MQLLTLGINHHTAPLALRERVVFPPDKMMAALAMLRAQMMPSHSSHLPEVAILSTCNRTELYFSADEANEAMAKSALEWLSQYHQISTNEIAPHIYTLTQADAARHAFRVASGLDSMVLGETQILGQMKEAARTAKQANTLGTYLNQLFQRAFAAAKAVRGRTAIGAHSISMAAASVRLAQRLFTNLSEQKILFIGAGEMINLCATHFCAQHPCHVVVANRSTQRAAQLVARLAEQGLHANTIELTEVHEQLAEFDIVICCTASPVPIIDLDCVTRALRTRRRRPIFMIDLAVPRDIAAEVAQLEDVFLYTMDDLGEIIREGHSLRQAATQQAEAIIQSHIQAFVYWLNQRKIVPLIQHLHQYTGTACQLELTRARKQLAQGMSTDAVLEQFARALTKKFLHTPLHALSHTPHNDEREVLQRVISTLFRHTTHSER